MAYYHLPDLNYVGVGQNNPEGQLGGCFAPDRRSQREQQQQRTRYLSGSVKSNDESTPRGRFDFWVEDIGHHRWWWKRRGQSWS